MSDHKCCRDMLEMISEYIDGSIDEASCEALLSHLKDCENCSIVLETLQKTIFLYRDAAEKTPVPDDVRERLFQCLGMEDLIG